jgi:hypothetical protein
VGLDKTRRQREQAILDGSERFLPRPANVVEGSEAGCNGSLRTGLPPSREVLLESDVAIDELDANKSLFPFLSCFFLFTAIHPRVSIHLGKRAASEKLLAD